MRYTFDMNAPTAHVQHKRPKFCEATEDEESEEEEPDQMMYFTYQNR